MKTLLVALSALSVFVLSGNAKSFEISDVAPMISVKVYLPSGLVKNAKIGQAIYTKRMVAEGDLVGYYCDKENCYISFTRRNELNSGYSRKSKLFGYQADYKLELIDGKPSPNEFSF